MSPHEERKLAEQARDLVKANEILATPAALENLRFEAQYRRQKYLAHVAAGFTTGEALYLCTH